MVTSERERQRQHRRNSKDRRERRLLQIEQKANQYRGRGALKCAICEKPIVKHETFDFCEAPK
jgi:hypothetical protein